MKHIDKNFKNAETELLSNYEVSFLRQFLKEQISIESVECIYLLPIYKKVELAHYPIDYCAVKIKVIANHEQEYLNLEIEKSIYDVIYNMNNKRYLPLNEFVFETADIKKTLSLDQNYLLKKSYENDLISSYILFDRNGIFEKLQDELSTKKESYKSLARIVNIDELNIEPFKKKVLSINK